MQVATTPKLVAVSVEVGSVTHRLIEAGGGFAVSLLARADRAVVRRFVKPADQVTVVNGVATAMQREPVFEVAGGLPVLVSSVGWLACRLHQAVQLVNEGAPLADAAAQLADAAAQLASEGAPLASHALFVGEVIDAGEAAPTSPTAPSADTPGADPASGTGDARPEMLRMEDTRMNYGG
jgi:flavin reductase (DIM6/NTAB) family NADH-FMN oxidoreductase RutF